MDGPKAIFEIHPSSGVPIYRQLIDQVHALLASGKLREGDFLPSVRSVAKSAAINPMTVSKAYSQLEAAGVVERIRGQGMRVCKSAAVGSLKQRKSQFQKLVQPALHRSRQLGLTETQVRDVLELLLKKLRKK